MAAITDPILLDSTGQEIVEALETIAENMGTSAGHTIQNDSGTDMQRRDKLQFKGVYVEDDQTNDVTKVDICRTMTKAQMEALSGEALKGFINTSDEPDSLPLTAEWVLYDSNKSVKDKIDEIGSQRIEKGVAYSLSHIICAGHNSGSGNYVEIFLPCNYDPTISSMALSSNSSLVVYSVNGIVTESGIDFSTQTLTKTALGLRLELKYSSTKTANIPVSVGFSTSSIVFS